MIFTTVLPLVPPDGMTDPDFIIHGYVKLINGAHAAGPGGVDIMPVRVRRLER